VVDYCSVNAIAQHLGWPGSETILIALHSSSRSLLLLFDLPSRLFWPILLVDSSGCH
jgi:hypothetical protein